MKLTSLFAILFCLATVAFGVPVKGAKKGPNPLKAALKPAVPDKDTPPIGSLVKVKLGAIGADVSKALKNAKHPAIVIGEKDADGKVPLAQLSHGASAFEHSAVSSDIIPTLSSLTGFDKHGKADASRQSVVNVGSAVKAHVNDIEHDATSGLTATADEVDNIKNTIDKVATTNPAKGLVSSVAADAKSAASAVEGASKSGVAGDAEKAVSDVASGVEDASKSGVLKDAEGLLKDLRLRRVSRRSVPARLA